MNSRSAADFGRETVRGDISFPLPLLLSHKACLTIFSPSSQPAVSLDPHPKCVCDWPFQSDFRRLGGVVARSQEGLESSSKSMLDGRSGWSTNKKKREGERKEGRKERRKKVFFPSLPLLLVHYFLSLFLLPLFLAEAQLLQLLQLLLPGLLLLLLPRLLLLLLLPRTYRSFIRSCNGVDLPSLSFGKAILSSKEIEAIGNDLYGASNSFFFNSFFFAAYPMPVRFLSATIG